MNAQIETMPAPAEGSIGGVVAQLVAWVCNSPGGLACVVYDSEYARRAAEERLRNALTEVNIPVVAFELPAEQPAAEVARCLARRLSQIPSGVASISGFATAFTPDVPLPESLGTLNYQRETLAHLPLCQIWWLPRRFDEALSNAAPDTYSWFLVRLELTEGVARAKEGVEIASGASAVRLDEARRHAASLVVRLRSASRGGASIEGVLPLAAAALDALVKASAFRAVAVLEDRLVRFLSKSARDAQSLGALALGATQVQGSAAAVGTPRVLDRLGQVYVHCGRYDEAEPLLRRALAIVEDVQGPEHPDTAHALNSLALLHLARRMYAVAYPLFGRALAIREKTLGPDHLDTAKALHNLALVCQDLGMLAESESLYGRAASIIETALGPEHPDTALALSNLAAVYRDLGRYAEAHPLLARALAIREKALGPDHVETGKSLYNLALIRQDLGGPADAIPLCARAVATLENTLGPEHPDTASAISNLAILYERQGMYADSEPLSVRVLAIREKMLGPEHPDTAKALHNLAVLYARLGRPAEAKLLSTRAVAILERVLGAEHPDTVIARSNLDVLPTHARVADSDRETGGSSPV